MAKKHKFRAKQEGKVTVLKMLLQHPMETGFRKDRKTGGTTPAHFIQELQVLNGEEVLLNLDMGGGVSRNPYFTFRFATPKKGDQLLVKWSDTAGKAEQAKVPVR